jgi:hypothetical protein
VNRDHLSRSEQLVLGNQLVEPLEGKPELKPLPGVDGSA